jgi:hypothetical protein
MALRTVWSVQCRWQAMAVVDCPAALARSIWQRRTVKADVDRRPVFRVARSSAVSERTTQGVCILNSIPHAQKPLLEVH